MITISVLEKCDELMNVFLEFIAVRRKVRRGTYKDIKELLISMSATS